MTSADTRHEAAILVSDSLKTVGFFQKRLYATIFCRQLIDLVTKTFCRLLFRARTRLAMPQMTKIWWPEHMVKDIIFEVQSGRRRVPRKRNRPLRRALVPVNQRSGGFTATDFTPGYKFIFTCASPVCNYALSPWSIQATNENMQSLLRLAKSDMKLTYSWRQLNQTGALKQPRNKECKTDHHDLVKQPSLSNMPPDVLYLFMEILLEDHVQHKHLTSLRYYVNILRLVFEVSEEVIGKFLAVQANKHSAQWALRHGSKQAPRRGKTLFEQQQTAISSTNGVLPHTMVLGHDASFT